MKPLFRDKHREHDPVWHVQAAMIVAIALQLALPDTFSLGRYILPFVELALLIALAFTTPKQRSFKSRQRRLNVFLLIGLTSFANAYSLIVITNRLLNSGGVANGKALILASINIFVTNVIIFGLWYWEMDGGGPGERHAIAAYEQDFIFVQHRNSDYRHPNWKPTFIDYLYTSATNAMSFAPAGDSIPLTRRAKMLMLLQSVISLITVALVAARAVGILN